MLRLTQANAAPCAVPAEPPPFGPIPLPILSSPVPLPTLCPLLFPMTRTETHTRQSSPSAGSALPFVSSLQYGDFFGLTRASVTIKISLAYLSGRN